ncbi:MAG: peptidoglycan DD-metalloendopeptidase family protein [Bacteroidota bacterium]|nr:peptidoglycan DD-metalloendopeptidase family protein [Bacteroidota bacterium]
MRLKKFSIPILICCLVSAYFFYNRYKQSVAHIDPIAEEILEELDSAQFEIKEPTLLYGIIIDSLEVIEDKIKPRQNLSHILAPYNISGNLISELSQKSKGVFDLRALAANKKYTILCSTDSLKTAKCFIYEPNETEFVVFNLQDSVHVYKVEKEVEVVERSISGMITSSLSNAMTENGASPQLVYAIYDIFKWQIEFNRVYKGDKYKLIYEEKKVDGKVIGLGRVLAAYFEHNDKDYYGIPFNQGKGTEYFDDHGKNLRKAFLKEPLNYTRISSRFSAKRFHPVQQRYKAHLGTDYAAPHGTPIMSVGNGMVLEAKYGQFNGNYVKIKHDGVISTQYLHMSKIASGIRPGVKVNQGQVIGYVGSTGLATGPHLCFRFWKNGVQVDALKVIPPPSDPIKKEFEEAYAVVKEELVLRLQSVAYENPVDEEVVMVKNIVEEL